MHLTRLEMIQTELKGLKPNINLNKSNLNKSNINISKLNKSNLNKIKSG